MRRRTISIAWHPTGRATRPAFPPTATRPAAMGSTHRPSSRPPSLPFIELMDDAHDVLSNQGVDLIGIEPVHEGEVQAYARALDQRGHLHGHPVGAHIEVGPTGDGQDG